MIVKAIVSYDGFNYAGWQKQENALGIQQVIEEALYKITKEYLDLSRNFCCLSLSQQGS